MPLLAVEVTFLPATWNTIASDGVSTSTTVNYTGITIFDSPEGLTQTAVDGATTTTSDIFLRKSGQGALLRNDYNMSRAGSPRSESFIIVRANFTVSAPTTYAISGFLSALSTASLLNTYEANADLREWGTNNSLFRNIQQTINWETEEFTLGLAEGNSQNQLQGSLTGMLRPGTQYEFTGTASIRNFSSVTPTGSASASGFVELSIGEATIPEPSAIALVMLGIFGLGRGRFRTR